MSQFKTIDNFDLSGKRVLVRVDFNVPVVDGKISDNSRIVRVIPTLKDLKAKGAKIILMAHFGRPKGKAVPEMTLLPVVAGLSEALGGEKISFAPDCIGSEAAAKVEALGEGEILLLENLRFHAGEEANDPAFAAELAKLGDLYINDAFSAAHRAHASTEALARLLPAAAGRLMQMELEHLEQALGHPKRPVAALVGGAKVSTKLDLLGNLVGKVDVLVIGGGMANTFLNAQGIAVGRSLCEHEMADTARTILEEAEKRGCKVILPSDVVVATGLSAGVATSVVAATAVPENQMILDAGPASAQEIAAELKNCKTLVWNGPLGCFETKPFDQATNQVAQAAAALTKSGHLLTVAGGGDTVSALIHAGVEQDFSYISTAGGAFLEWLEGKTLPGVQVLQDVA
ncbi:phosphoglycerate kinase [Kiloniella laminariae]|uniref:Phosphoglycerate kinase n=1 Tax=Kiloniella laminariae TaxID=454162 RepID=A0ABT4LMT3_9PROT|nr:phosphoglycerate kinase [Kiloniella laminariae]MCZ4282381.1 phosphoglycerate kinase [Kiloniella laminariae]